MAKTEFIMREEVPLKLITPRHLIENYLTDRHFHRLAIHHEKVPADQVTGSTKNGIDQLSVDQMSFC